MAVLPQTLNGIQAPRVRLTIPWRGCWFADVDLNALDVTTLVLTGPATLVVGGVTLLGKFDPRGSSAFGSKATARVVGGFGWSTLVARQQFNNPGGGLISTLVYSTTAEQVGEPPPIDPTPIVFGENYLQVVGPASRVFGDRDWYVNPTTGVVTVASWTPSTFVDGAASTITDWFPQEARARISGDTFPLPGTIISDIRLGAATYTIRDVEATFSHEGMTCDVWCSAQNVSRLQSAFVSAVREAARTAWLKTYRYRYVISAGGNDLALQAITPGAPDINPIHQWEGLSGALNKLAPSTEIVVGFTGDDPAVPFLIRYSALATPIETDVDATTLVKLGASAAAIQIAGGGPAVGRVGDQVQVTFTVADGALIIAPPGTAGGPCSVMAPFQLTGTITQGSPKTTSG